jgi:Family of unknown function (DUF5309)
MSAIYSNSTDNVQVLKELYTDDSWVMKDLVFAGNPALALLPKDESADGMGGKSFPVPLIYGNAQGRSATFTNAQNNQTAPSLGEFFVTTISNYQLVTIDNRFMEATRSNVAAFMDGATMNVNGGINNITNDLAHDLFNDGSGSRGTYGLGNGSISAGVITLDGAAQSVQFDVGMTLVSYSVSGTTATQSTGAALGYVIAVDYDLGTVTVSASQGGSAGNPSSWSTSFPYLAVQGDVNFASGGLGSSLMLKLAGFGAWIPATAPGSTDSFFGQNRSVSPTRLAGNRFNGANETIEEALIDAAAVTAQNRSTAGYPDYCFMNFTSYAALIKTLGSRVQYVDVKHDEIDISFEGIQLITSYGKVTVLPDRNCPAQTAYLICMKTWKLRTLGRAPKILIYGSYDSNQGLRVGTADAVEIRIGYYGNLTCNGPVANCVVSLAQ